MAAVAAIATIATSAYTIYSQSQQKAPKMPDLSSAVPLQGAKPADVAQRRSDQSNALAQAGRQGTILTSPLGVPGTPASTSKTLLGL